MISINSSKQVLAFLPQNTWTEVILLSSSNNNNVHIVTTEHRIKKKLRDMRNMSMEARIYEKLREFKPLKMVAVEVEGKWHRGKLISFNEFKFNNTRIELIDDGSVHETELQNVLELPQYLMYDPLVLPVKFKNFTPKTKTLSIKPILSESELHEGVVLVEVKYSNGMEIMDALIEDQYLNKTNGTCSSYNLKKDCQSWQKPEDIPLKSGDCCIVTFIENFSDVYIGKAVKLVKDNTYEMCNFDIVEKTALSKDKILMCNPDVGDTVKVFTSKFDGLFRAKIIKNNNNGNYNVFYIDFGNTETVSSNDIYELSDELKKEPGLAIQIGLVGLNDIPFTKKIRREFANFIDNKKPFIIEFDDTSENCLKNVKLRDIENELYIYSYVMKWLPKDSDSKEPIQKIEKNTTDGHNINQSNNLKNNDTVYLKHFEDMDSVYIVKDAKIFSNIMLSVQDKSSVCKTNFNVGDIVKVHSTSSTSCSYRAIINKIDGTSISVLNIDIGYCDIVQKDSIYELPSELKKIPGLALKVGIKKPIIKKTQALTEFICNTEKVPLYLEYDINQEITLRRKDNSKNIFDEFLKTADHSIISKGILNNSEQDQITNKKNESLTNDFKYISLENGDYCMISHFEDFKSIYICKAIKNSSNDGPDHLIHNDVTILKTLSCKDRVIKTNPVVGDIVKVYSSEFDGLFRGKIFDIVNNADFHVFYIDFGNTEVVKSKDIFELSDNLKIKPGLAIKVGLSMLNNIQKNKEITKMFLNMAENRELLSINFDESSEDGLKNCILKVYSSGLIINKEVLELSSKYPNIALDKGHGSLNGSPQTNFIPLADKE